MIGRIGRIREIVWDRQDSKNRRVRRGEKGRNHLGCTMEHNIRIGSCFMS